MCAVQIGRTRAPGWRRLDAGDSAWQHQRMAKALRYLVTYDIADPKRLRRLHRFLAKRATAVQYSVFTAELTEASRRQLASEIEKRIDPSCDDVRFYPLPSSVDIEQLGAAAAAAGISLESSLGELLAGHEGKASGRKSEGPSKR